MASAKKVHLPDEESLSPSSQEQSLSWIPSAAPSTALGSLSRLVVSDASPEQVSMWREPGYRGERVTEAPSTSAVTLRQKAPGGRRRQLLAQPVDSTLGRQGPSNFTRLPDINLKPRSSPNSPNSHSNRPPRNYGPGTRRVSISSLTQAFIAGATVAGPLTPASFRPPAFGNNNTAVAAAAMFAMSAGQTFTAAGIAYAATGSGVIPAVPHTNVPTAAGAPMVVAAAVTAAQADSAAAGGTPPGGPASPPLVPPPPQTAPARTLISQGSGLTRGLSGGGDGLVGEDEGGGSKLQADDVLGDNDRLRSRLVSLPNIVCRSANGDVFLVDLGNVQAMLHKRELGEEGLNVLNRITPGLAHSIGGSGTGGGGGGGSPSNSSRRRRRRHSRRTAFLNNGTDTEDAGAGGGDRPLTLMPSASSKSMVAPSPALTRSNSVVGRGRGGRGGGAAGAGGAAAAAAIAAAADASGTGAAGAGGIRLDPAMEAELKQHLAATDELVEQRRLQLQEDWRLGRMTGVNPAAIAREQEEARRAAAIDFAVNLFVPRRLALMAHNMRPDAQLQTGLQGEGEGEAFGAEFSKAVKAPLWNKVQAGLDRLYDRMPFMTNWVATIKKLQREEGSGWDGLLNGVDELYVKGREEHQGTNIYVLKCHELGVTPSTQVIQQLSSPDSNMSHCHLGRQGAAALRHALSANVTITHLNLQDNHLDATSIESILAGLYSGTMAKQPKARKLLEKRMQSAAANLASATNGASSGGTGGAIAGASTGGAAGDGAPPGSSSGTGGPHVGFSSPPRRAPGDLSVRLIPANLLKEQEKRRLAEEERQRQEEVARLMEEIGPGGGSHSDAAAAAAAEGGLADAPEWLKIINDPSRLSGSNTEVHRPPSQSYMNPLLGGAFGSPPGGGVAAMAARLQRPAPASAPSHRLTCAITSLDLSNNPLGINGVRALADLLDPTVTPYQFVKQLFLNKCGVPEGGGRALAGALSRGNTRLAVLGLSNNALGNATAAMFGEVLALPSGLEDLDLSWNQIKSDGARDLAEGVAQNNTLKRLNLSWNGLENPGVTALGGMLERNESLTWLDLTNTRMGAEACLMLAEGIKANHTLEVLVLNGNSVGDDGARFLMDALKTNNSLRYLGLQGTNMSTAARGNSAAASFNPLSPDGTYDLDLSHGPDRAVALKLCEMDAAVSTDLMKNIRLGERNIPSCKAMKWPDCLPVSGRLCCDFVTRRIAKVVTVMETKKFNAMAAQFQANSMSDKERLALVEVMAPFNYVLCHQAATLLRAFSIGDEMVMAAALLFTRAADLDDNINALTDALGADASLDSLQGVLGWYSYVRFSNPTGHYELHLSSRVHCALATRLKDVACSEPVDVLNWHNLIHDQYSATTPPLKMDPNYGPPEAWKGVIPHVGTLSFDYVSGCTAAEDAPTVSDELLTEIITNDLGISLDPTGRPVPTSDHSAASRQVARLRPLVANMAFTAAQVKKLVESFQAPPHRVEVLVTCYCLIVDRANLWTIMYTMEPLEQALVVWRLGPANVFDKAHPTGHYVLDLHNPHHEAVAHKLVDLAVASPDLPNFWNLRLNGVRRSVTENRNMWGTFMAETQTPFMEFDYIGPDGFELMGRSKADVDMLGPGDRLDLRTKQARRMELSRVKTMYAYFEDGSGWQRPPWQSRQLLMRALADKAPWQAAWDRMARLLLRYDLRRGGIEGDSPVEDIFYNATSGEEAMTAEQFESVLKEWGYSRPEISFMQEAFEVDARQATPKDGPAYKPTVVKPATPQGQPSTPGAALGATSPTPGAGPDTPGTPGAAAAGTPASSSSPHGGFSMMARSITQRSGRNVSMGGGSAFVASAAAAVASSVDSPSASRGRHHGLLPAITDAQRSVSQQGLQLVPNMVVEYPLFVQLFMREPPRALRMRYTTIVAIAEVPEGSVRSGGGPRRRARG